VVGLPADVFSTFIGTLGVVEFSCDQSGSVAIRHGTGFTDLVGAPPQSSEVLERTEGSETLTINCEAGGAQPPEPTQPEELGSAIGSEPGEPAQPRPTATPRADGTEPTGGTPPAGETTTPEPGTTPTTAGPGDGDDDGGGNGVLIAIIVVVAVAAAGGLGVLGWRYWRGRSAAGGTSPGGDAPAGD
jgi:hypothetical protein